MLAHGIAEGQPFLDGNKRLALVAMLTFLEANGYRIDATDPELANWIIGFSGDLRPRWSPSTSGLVSFQPEGMEHLWETKAGATSGNQSQTLRSQKGA